MGVGGGGGGRRGAGRGENSRLAAALRHWPKSAVFSRGGREERVEGTIVCVCGGGGGAGGEKVEESSRAWLLLFKTLELFHPFPPQSAIFSVDGGRCRRGHRGLH